MIKFTIQNAEYSDEKNCLEIRMYLIFNSNEHFYVAAFSKEQAEEIVKEHVGDDSYRESEFFVDDDYKDLLWADLMDIGQKINTEYQIRRAIEARGAFKAMQLCDKVGIFGHYEAN